MADFEAPSFSLGLDFDMLDSEPQTTTVSEDHKNPSSSNQFSASATTLDVDDNDFETLTVVYSDSETQGSPPKLKRLRRWSTVNATSSSVSAKSKADLHSSVVVDDEDIEEFSSQEDRRTDEHLSRHHHSVYSSSKYPLNGIGVLTKQSGKRKQDVSNAPESVITSCKIPVFPKRTISPLRRFQLIDSDSDCDDLSVSEGSNNRKCDGSESYLNRRQANLTQHVGFSEQGKLNESINTSATKDLWEDFQPERSFQVPTPALDEFCNEYFRSMEDKNKFPTNTEKSNQSSYVTKSIIDLGDPLPPAHKYFFHHDLRVRELVRTRLPNFFPLCNALNKDPEQPSTSNIDYMGQFSHDGNSKPAARTNKAKKSARKNSTKSKTGESSQGSVSRRPDREKEIPKDAGKRRVQAVGQAAGRWFTNPDGKRVYVSKNGQELTGRAAYTLYRKESGAGFKKAKAKKKTSKKKK